MVNEKANVHVTLNSQEAQHQLEELQAEMKRLIALKKKAEEAGDVDGYKKIDKEIKKVSRSANKLVREHRDLEQTLKNLNGASIEELRTAQRTLTAQTSKLNRQTDEYTKKRAQLKLVKKELRNINSEYRQQNGLLKSIKTFLPAFSFAAVIAGATAFVRKMNQAVEAADNFEERLDNLSALTGLEGDALDKLGETAKQTSVKITEGGVRIKQSADDIVDAYTKVGSQRPELLKNGEALASVTEDAIILSEAAKSQLEPAVKGLTTTMNQFNIGADGSRRIINAMAAGSKEGAADIPYLTEAIEKSGTTMNLMNVSLEENIGLIEAVAPNYAKAQLAGNSLDKVFLKLKEKQIGYKDGVFSVNAALEELEQRYKNGESAASIFGVEHAKMGELLVQNKDEFNRYTKAVTGTNIAIEQAAKNTNNAKAIQAQARNEFHLAAIELGQNLSPAMTLLYKTAGRVARSFSDMISKSPSDSLRDQQNEVNGLIVELRSANIEEERRNTILSRLKEISPDLLKTITDEKSSMEDLTKAVAAYNEEMALKILIAEGEEDITKQKAKVDAFRKLSAEAEAELARQLRSSISWFEKKAPDVKESAEAILFDTQKTLLQKAEELNRLALDNTTLGNTALFSALDSYRIFKQNYSTELNSLNVLISKTGETKEEWKNIFGGNDSNTNSAALPAGTRMFLNGMVWEWYGKGLKIVQKPEPDTSGKSLIKIQQEALDLAKQMPEITEAEIFAKNQKIAAIEKEIDRLKNLGIESKESLKFAELLTASDEEQKLAIQKYFSKLGEGAFEDFINSFQSAKEKGSIDFSIVSKIQTEEEDQTDPTTDYAIQKYQETLDFKFALAESMYEKGLIGEQQYQDQLTELTRQAEQERYEIKRENIEKYQQIAGFAANFVSSMMDMELAKAGDNEEKKKKIKKKYADLNFAVTAANIVANTAGAIMKGYEQLGPLGGTIAAVLLGATGLVQLGIANAERKKVKSYAEGKYPNLQYTDNLQTGMYGDQPHMAIFNEVPGQPEIVIDGRTNRNLSMNYPEIIRAIYAVRDGRRPDMYADGKYNLPAAADSNPTQPYTPYVIDVDKFDKAVTRLENIKIPFSYDKFERLQDEYKRQQQGSSM